MYEAEATEEEVHIHKMSHKEWQVRSRKGIVAIVAHLTQMKRRHRGMRMRWTGNIPDPSSSEISVCNLRAKEVQSAIEREHWFYCGSVQLRPSCWRWCWSRFRVRGLIRPAK